jgi:propanediol utilization protein
MRITVGVSRRHVHLSKKTCKELFGSYTLPIRNPLNQPGQYASTLTVDLKWKDKVIPHVRICGPIRKYDQVEVAKEEADELNVNPPVRQSGDLKGSLPITLVGPKGEVTIKEGLIMAGRHVHIDSKEAKNLCLKNKEVVAIYKNRKELFKAQIKIENPSFTELHIDTHEEIIYDLHQGDEVEVYKCGK